MTGPDIHGWSSRLPEWADGTLSPAESAALEAAMAADPELRAEAELVQSLLEARVEPPAGLAETISARLDQERVQQRGRSGWSAGWRLSTAAVLILAMGSAVVWNQLWSQRGPLPALDGAPGAASPPLSDSWLLDDGVVAGGAVLDDLTEEELVLLLAELEG